MIEKKHNNTCWKENSLQNIFLKLNERIRRKKKWFAINWQSNQIWNFWKVELVYMDM